MQARGRFAAAVAAAMLSVVSGSQAIKVNYLGNSLTHNIELAGLKSVFAAQAVAYDYTASIMAGVPLQWWADHKDCFIGNQTYVNGYNSCYPASLTKAKWDALCIQPFGKQLWEDLPDGNRIIKETRAVLPNVTFYMYARWADLNFGSYAVAWNYNYKNDRSWENNTNRKYFESLLSGWRQSNPEATILMVPVGYVMYVLDEQIRKGEVPGIAKITDFYEPDLLHFNAKGTFLLQMVFYATFAKKTPVGIAVNPAYSLSAEAAGKIQETVWSVVSTHPYAGVATGTSRTGTSVERHLSVPGIAATSYNINGRRVPPGSQGIHAVRGHGLTVKITGRTQDIAAKTVAR